MGLVQNSYKPSTWATRRSVNGGASWTTVDSFPTTRGSSSQGTAVDSKGNVTVVGFGLNSASEGLLWTVRQSRDKGVTWATIDSTAGRAFGVTTVPRADGTALPDDIYVSGDVTTTFSMYWVVRKLTASLSAQGSITWSATVVDSSQPVSAQTVTACGGPIYVPASATLCVTGTAVDSAATHHWITRSALLQ